MYNYILYIYIYIIYIYMGIAEATLQSKDTTAIPYPPAEALHHSGGSRVSSLSGGQSLRAGKPSTCSGGSSALVKRPVLPKGR